MITFPKKLPELKSSGTQFLKYLVQDYQLLWNKMQTKFRGLTCSPVGGWGEQRLVDIIARLS